MKMGLDGIYLWIKRDGKIVPVCLSDMTKEDWKKIFRRTDQSGCV